MKELEHISEGLDKLMVDITVRCMLNPNNKDFYIGTLTLDKVKSMFAEMNDADLEILDIFWSAYSIAEAKYLEEQRLLKEYNEAIAEEIEHYVPIDFSAVNEILHVCPECGCRDYVQGVRCPNCDYVDED